MNRKQTMDALVEFFQDQGRILTRTEYGALGGSAPVPGRFLKRWFIGKSYPQIISILRKSYPTQFAAIGTIFIDSEEPLNTVQDQEDNLSPLEKLRQKSNG